MEQTHLNHPGPSTSIFYGQHTISPASFKSTGLEVARSMGKEMNRSDAGNTVFYLCTPGIPPGYLCALSLNNIISHYFLK